MRHFIDLTTEELRELCTLLSNDKQMPELLEKLQRHLNVPNHRNKYGQGM